jgi:hypothetical protein
LRGGEEGQVCTVVGLVELLNEGRPFLALFQSAMTIHRNLIAL